MAIDPLRWEQVDLERGLITVKKSKSGKIRHVPINIPVRATLENLGPERTGSVFTWRGRAILRITKSFREAVKNAGIAHCTPHTMRHTFASRLVEAGVDLVTVQQLLGHANIQTTVRYAHPGPAHIKDAVARLVPDQSGLKVDHGALAAPKQTR